MRRLLGCALGGLMLLGACSDSDNEGDGDAKSDNGSDADAYIEASAEKLQTNTEGLGLDEETATCFAAAGVNTVGVEAFKDADVSPEDLANADSIGSLDIEIPDGAVEDLAAALEDCNLAKAFSSALIQGMVAASGSEVSDDAVACMGDHIDEADFANAAALSTLSKSTDEGDAAMGEVFGVAFAACPDVMTEILVAGFSSASQTEMSDATKQCLAAYVEANPEAVAQAFSGTEAEGEDALGEGLVAACPEAMAGVGG
jgi:hypothetical protein